MNWRKQHINRKEFLRWAGILALVPFLYFWYSVIRVKSFQDGRKKIEIPLSAIVEGLSFHDQVIINREGNTFLVFSSKCTHLGCNITEKQGGKIICPCHGSQYDYEGNVIKGPATKRLKRLDFLIEEKEKMVVVMR